MVVLIARTLLNRLHRRTETSKHFEDEFSVLTHQIEDIHVVFLGRKLPLCMIEKGMVDIHFNAMMFCYVHI